MGSFYSELITYTYNELRLHMGSYKYDIIAYGGHITWAAMPTNCVGVAWGDGALGGLTPLRVTGLTF